MLLRVSAALALAGSLAACQTAPYAAAPAPVYRPAPVYQPAPAPVYSGLTPAPAQRTGEVAVGTALGAVAGGLLGSRFGEGDGKKLAIIGGALLGGLVGNQMAAQYWTEQDNYYLQQTSQNALTTGQTQTWVNPQTNLRGEVTPVRSYNDTYGQQCSQIRQTIYLPNGEPQTAMGNACRQADGTWRIVS